MYIQIPLISLYKHLKISRELREVFDSRLRNPQRALLNLEFQQKENDFPNAMFHYGIFRKISIFEHTHTPTIK